MKSPFSRLKNAKIGVCGDEQRGGFAQGASRLWFMAIAGSAIAAASAAKDIAMIWSVFMRV